MKAISIASNQRLKDEDDLEKSSALLGSKYDDGKRHQPGGDYQPSPPPQPKAASVTGKGLFFFLILIGQSIGTQTLFKLSQRNGEYKYNTMSAMAVVEGVKLALTCVQHLVEKRGSVTGCVAAFGGVTKRVYLAYAFLALSYAVYNQTIFYVMTLVDPGTFSLFKSLLPAVTAGMSYVIYDKRLTQAHVFCILIQICGIVPVTAAPNPDSGKVELIYGVRSVVVMSAIQLFSSFNTVYNAAVIKKDSANYSIAVMNSILYAGGWFFNLLFYVVARRPGDASFFYGYDNVYVAALLFLNSTVGITISMVYKHGDAVLKTLAQPATSAVLLFLSNVVFGTSLDAIKISGAGTVILSTMLYIRLPPPPASEERKDSDVAGGGDGSKMRRAFAKSRQARLLLVVVLALVLTFYLQGGDYDDYGDDEFDPDAPTIVQAEDDGGDFIHEDADIN